MCHIVVLGFRLCQLDSTGKVIELRKFYLLWRTFRKSVSYFCVIATKNTSKRMGNLSKRTKSKLLKTIQGNIYYWIIDFNKLPYFSCSRREQWRYFIIHSWNISGKWFLFSFFVSKPYATNNFSFYCHGLKSNQTNYSHTWQTSFTVSLTM